jgi:Spy/CpxP family protein refolding chaperone
MQQFIIIEMENRNYNILKWSVGILAVLNIVLMVTMWMGSRNHRHGPPRPGEGGPKNMIIHELEFNETQVKKFEELVEQHRSGMRDLEKKGRDVRENYFKLMASDSLDYKAKENFEAAIAENQKNIEAFTFDHFRQVRVLCNDKQKKKFDKMIGEIMQHMRGPHGPPPPHPPHEM